MRTIVVSNRLPVVVDCTPDGPVARPSSGGLVSALEPVLQRRSGVWIGWPGAINADADAVDAMLAQYGRTRGFDLKPVPLSLEEEEGFYHGFCNEIIWPLFHDLQSRCNFVPEYWTIYQNVTRKFADAVESAVEPGDFIWVQDYHLIGLARELRRRGIQNKIGFFLHIPFPPPDIFCKLPWRADVLESLCHYGVIGLQTPHDKQNFIDCVRRLLPRSRIRAAQGLVECERGGWATKVGAFPIGIDYSQFAEAAAGEAVTQRMLEIRSEMPEHQIILGVDRLDYTKGIPERLQALRLALKRFPELLRNVTLLQVVVPSREGVSEYQELKGHIERLVSQINGEFTQGAWVPIHYVFRSLTWEDLLAYYRVADVALLTPLKDGMNLVAKEYCACQVEGDGVLILSEFAGTAVQMKKDAIIVNPYDLDQVATAIHDAVSMPTAKRRAPMRRLRKISERQDVFWWADQFLEACGVGDKLPVSKSMSVPAIAPVSAPAGAPRNEPVGAGD